MEVFVPPWSGTQVLVTVTRLVDASAQPPLVEADLVDADGIVWTFVEKGPVFLASDVDLSSLPHPGAIRCEIVRDEMVAGVLIVHIDTSAPDGLESVDGVSRFRVLRAMVP